MMYHYYDEINHLHVDSARHDAKLSGTAWPRDATEAAGPIPEELWEISLSNA